MIPNLSYPGILTPLNLDPQPLVNRDAVLSQFDLSNSKHQILHLDQSVLKPDIINALFKRGLIIEKVDIWRWNLSLSNGADPHSDGPTDGTGRSVGVNWSMFSDDSGVEFYDNSEGNTVYEEMPDGRTHTSWLFPTETPPLVVWRSRYPSLINTQAPHRVVGPPGSFRYSITLKLKPNLTYSAMQARLWDLRVDHDYWPANIDISTVKQIANIVARIENNAEFLIPAGSFVAYNLPADAELLKIFYQFCKKPIKNFRVFKYTSGAKAHMHIDYDANLKKSPAYALNIPLYGSDNSEIIFYKNMGGLIEVTDSKTGSRLKATDVNLVYRSSSLYITSPHLIRTNILHEVDIHNTTDRKVLSVRFMDDELDNPTDILSNIKPKFS
jgi:hypothetical protein